MRICSTLEISPSVNSTVPSVSASTVLPPSTSIGASPANLLSAKESDTGQPSPLTRSSSWLQRADRKEISRLGPLESTRFRVGSKVGEVYQTPEQAEADVKRLCKESKAEDWPPCDPGNAE